jgi:drug/metabolite transporter (DMT)-like permease
VPAPNRFGVIAAWCVLCTIWSSTWLTIKIGLTELPPVWFVATRFVIASAILFALCIGRFPILMRNRADYLFVAVTGVLTFTINYGLLFWGEQHVSSGLAAVLQATIPIFGLVFAHFHLPGERMQWTKLLGALLGVTGVAIICSKVLDVQGALAFRGGLAVVVGGAATAYANVLIKMRGNAFPPAVLAAWQMLFGLPLLFVVGFWQEGNPLLLHWSVRSVSCVLYLALFGSAVGFLLFYWLLRRMAVVKAQTISLLTPPLAVAIGWLFGGEEMSRWALLGASFILIGVSLIFWRIPARGAPGLTGVPANSDA